MKNPLFLVFIALATLAFTVFPQGEASPDSSGIKWQSDFDQAFSLAKKKNEPLLILFTGSDWCAPCKMLHEDLFENEDFIKYADKNLILYKADFPRRIDTPITEEQKAKNIELRNKFRISGFPTIILINAKGDVIGTQSGYSRMMSTEYHLKTIQNAVENYK